MAKKLNQILNLDETGIAPATAAFIDKHKVQVHDHPHNGNTAHTPSTEKDMSRSQDQSSDTDLDRYDGDPLVVDIAKAMASSKAEFNKIYGTRNSAFAVADAAGRSAREGFEWATDELIEEVVTEAANQANAIEPYCMINRIGHWDGKLFVCKDNQVFGMVKDDDDKPVKFVPVPLIAKGKQTESDENGIPFQVTMDYQTFYLRKGNRIYGYQDGKFVEVPFSMSGKMKEEYEEFRATLSEENKKSFDKLIEDCRLDVVEETIAKMKEEADGIQS